MTDTMDREKIKHDFNRDGFVIVPQFFDPKQLQQIHEELDRYMKMLPQLPVESAFYEDKSDPSSLKRLDQLGKDDYFHNLLKQSPWVILVEYLMGQPMESKGIMMFANPPRIGKKTPPHQDGYYYMIEPNEAAMTWLALDEVDESNGCVCYVPGSHRRGLRDHKVSNVLGFSLSVADYGPEDAALEVSACVHPGDLIVHHSLTIHSAQANNSNRRRWAIGCEYRSTLVKEDLAKREAHNQMMKKAWAEQDKF